MATAAALPNKALFIIAIIVVGSNHGKPYCKHHIIHHFLYQSRCEREFLIILDGPCP